MRVTRRSEGWIACQTRVSCQRAMLSARGEDLSESVLNTRTTLGMGSCTLILTLTS